MILHRKTTVHLVLRTMAGLIAALSLVAVLAIPASAQPPSPTSEPFSVGFFYGTFGPSPNTVLLVGGTVEQFCEANPDDPFNGEPGTAMSQTVVASDGTVKITVHDSGQPIHLYRTLTDDSPRWIGQVCADYFAGSPTPVPFASGLAVLRARINIVSENRIEVFNSATGWARGIDGTHYRVTGSADLVVVDGAPVGNPADFVSFQLQAYGRHVT